MLAKLRLHFYSIWKKIMVSMATEFMRNSDLVDFGCHGNMTEHFFITPSLRYSKGYTQYHPIRLYSMSFGVANSEKS